MKLLCINGNPSLEQTWRFPFSYSGNELVFFSDPAAAKVWLRTGTYDAVCVGDNLGSAPGAHLALITELRASGVKAPIVIHTYGNVTAETHGRANLCGANHVHSERDGLRELIRETKRLVARMQAKAEDAIPM